MGRLVGLREQFGGFIGPPKRKAREKREKPRRKTWTGEPPHAAPASHERPDGELPRVGDYGQARCDVCGRMTTWRCFKLSKGRGKEVRMLEIMLERDVSEDSMRTRFSAQVDDARYVAFWLCTESGHVARERETA